MPVSCTDQGGTILFSDGGVNWYIKKQKVSVEAVGTNVIIREDSVHYITFPAADFTSPSGTAASIASAIEAFLDV